LRDFVFFMENEIWVKILLENGECLISNLGRIKRGDIVVNCKAGGKRIYPSKIINQYINSNGYSKVLLYKKIYAVHRLVALAFIPNPENKRAVNHINGVKSDNKVQNLEWVTDKENTQHSYDKLNRKPADFLFRRGEKHRDAKKIVQYELDGTFVKVWGSIIDAANSLGHKSYRNISECVRNKSKSAYGYLWKLYDGNLSNIEPYKCKSKSVIQFDLHKCFIKKWVSVTMAAKALNINLKSINNCCKKIQLTAGGFKWEYKK